MTGAIIVTWGGPVRGRELKGLEVFGEALAYFEGLAKQGTIHGHREYFALTGNVSERSGTMVVEGEIEELLKLQVNEEFRSLVYKAQAITDNFTVEVTVGGSDQAIQSTVTAYMETLQSLGLV